MSKTAPRPRTTPTRSTAKKAAARTSSAKKKPTAKKAVKKATARKVPAKKTAAKQATPRKKTTGQTRTTRTTVTSKAAVKKATKTATKTVASKTVVARKPATPRLPADVKLAIAAAQDKLAQDLTVLDLRNASAFTDFFIVCTGTNTRQVQAISDAVEASLKAAGQPAALVEGYRRGEWILLDYFSFIVHVFLPAQREFYALERLWGGAEPIEVSAP